ncbi:MAG: hypothetical protein ACJ8J0_20530 [Longimicrobiaceae bacterium]
MKIPRTFMGISASPGAADLPRSMAQQRPSPTVPLVRGSASVAAHGVRSPFEVADEAFYVEVEDSFYYIRHNRWSLVGMGKTLTEAKRDLLAEAADLRKVLASTSSLPMDAELERLAAFLQPSEPSRRCQV